MPRVYYRNDTISIKYPQINLVIHLKVLKIITTFASKNNLQLKLVIIKMKMPTKI